MQNSFPPVLPPVCFSDIKCELCESKKNYKMNQYPADFIPLTCSHALCVNCFEKHLGDTLDTGASQILCPAKNCGKFINFYLAESNFQNGFEVYEKRILESMPVADVRLEKKGKPSDSASNRMEIEGNPNENRKEMDSEDFINETYMKCPTCKVPIEKIRGCYTMQCKSATCQGKTTFCYLCGLKLPTKQTEKEHYGGNSFQKCKRMPNKNE